MRVLREFESHSFRQSPHEQGLRALFLFFPSSTLMRQHELMRDGCFVAERFRLWIAASWPVAILSAHRFLKNPHKCPSHRDGVLWGDSAGTGAVRVFHGAGLAPAADATPSAATSTKGCS